MSTGLCMMINDDEEQHGHCMLAESDFPNYFVNFCHPEDYIIRKNPFTEKILHWKRHHNRLFLRICFKIDEKSFLPLTFILDTGSPSHIYLCKKAKDEIESIINEDELQNEYILLNGKKLAIHETPYVHQNVNIIGLLALSYFGFYLKGNSFELEDLPEYF